MQSVFDFDPKARLRAIREEMAAKTANFAKNSEAEPEEFSKISNISSLPEEEPVPETLVTKQIVQSRENPPELTPDEADWQKQTASYTNKMKPENRMSFSKS